MKTARCRQRGPFFLAFAGVALLFAACGGGSIDLPAVEVGRSSHFRYYARAADRVPVSVLDLLEAHWTEMSTFFGLGERLTVSYYLFDSREDFVMHGPCPSAGACAMGSSVYSDTPFNEHELIHTYFSTLGVAPPFVAEGVASALSCFDLYSAPASPPTDASWQAAARNVHLDTTDYGQSRLIRYLIRQHGPQAFAAYYSASEYTLDPALFAAQFEAFWGDSIDVVWAAATGAHPTPTYLDVAMCPCSGAALPIDGTPDPIVALYGAYASPLPFTVGTESDVAVSLRGLGGTAIRNCWDQDYEMHLLQSDTAAPPADVLLRLPAGHFYVQALPQGTAPASISILPGSWLAAVCASGEIFSVASGFVGNVEISSPGSTTFMQLSVAGPRTATVGPSPWGLSLCPACDSPSGDCTTVPPSTSASITLNGAYVVKLDPGQQVSLGF